MYHQKKADEKLAMEISGARCGDSWYDADATLWRTRQHIPNRYRLRSASNKVPVKALRVAYYLRIIVEHSAQHAAELLIALTEEISQSRSADYIIL